MNNYNGNPLLDGDQSSDESLGEGFDILVSSAATFGFQLLDLRSFNVPPASDKPLIQAHFHTILSWTINLEHQA